MFELRAETANIVYIPRGIAHGFYTLSESATMMYKVSTVYAPNHDAGIHWDSVGVNWPSRLPILSQRDSELPPFSNFKSPFVFNPGTP
jgi:dTDP-4-dehydrorhamnose 3,5-epimerase